MNRAPDWFGSAMARLMSAYPSWPCTVGTVQVFWDSLCDLKREDIERSVAAYIARERAWPIAAALRALAKATGQPEQTASEAWDEMYAHRHKHTANPRWSSEAVERAARAVNWNDPCWLAEQIPTIRAQFERYFVANSKKVEKVEAYHEGLELLARSVGKDAKQLYGKDFLIAEKSRVEEDTQMMNWLKTDDVDPPQIDEREEY